MINIIGYVIYHDPDIPSGKRYELILKESEVLTISIISTTSDLEKTDIKGFKRLFKKITKEDIEFSKGLKRAIKARTKKILPTVIDELKSK